MLKLNSIMLGSDQPDVLGEFYEKVFGKAPNMHEGNWYGWQFDGFNFSVGEHSEVKGKNNLPQRVIFNIESSDVKEDFKKVAKIEGVEVVKEPYSMEGWEGAWIATLADPDGNYFQLMSPWKD